MKAYGVKNSRWVYKLVLQLTNEAQQAYAALTAEEPQSYDQLKEAILRCYDINEETYHQWFCTTTRKAEELHRQLVTHLEHLQQKWMKGRTTVQQVSEAIVLEQFFDTLTPDVCLWVKEGQLKTARGSGVSGPTLSRKEARPRLEGEVRSNSGGREETRSGLHRYQRRGVTIADTCWPSENGVPERGWSSESRYLV